MHIGTELPRRQTCLRHEVNEVRRRTDDHVVAAALQFQTERYAGLDVPRGCRPVV